MPFTLACVVVAVAASLVRGGRLHRLGEAPLRWSWLLFAGLVLQFAVDFGAARGWLADAGTVGYALLLASQLLVLGWVVLNRQLPGMALVVIGLVSNAVVIGANGAMPVDPEAIRALGVSGPIEVPPGKHTLMTEATRLPWLADIWAVAPLRTIISVGDVVLALGLVPLTHALMTADPAAEPDDGASAITPRADDPTRDPRAGDRAPGSTP